jgi:hypothetical protein
MSLTDELQRLQELHERGALSDAEYAQAKAALLKNPPAQRGDGPAPSPRGGRDLLGEAAKTWVNFYIAMTVIGLVIAAIFFLAFWLPEWNRMQEKHEQFDREWNKARQEQDEFRQRHFPGP